MKSFFVASLGRGKPALSRWLVWSLAGCVAAAVLLRYFGSLTDTETTNAASLTLAESTEPIQPIKAIAHLNSTKIELGRELFHDVRLSRNNRVSCAHCHDLTHGGADDRVRSVGVNGAVGLVNSPTVLNSGFNFSQFWDGRAPTLEAQIDEPVLSPLEMGSSWADVIAKLRASPEYIAAFRKNYGDQVRTDHVKNAIAEFERSLSTPDSPFDRYLRHETGALNQRAKRGYDLFKSFGCASCHQGENVGGNMYQKFGIMAPYFTDRGHITRADQGRFNVTGNPNDRYMFKVPSLRNVALTAPYFHDGSAATLPDAVRMMAKYQLGRHLTGEETDLIVEFLGTLTGQLEGQAL